MTGDGVDAALAGVDAVIDATNVASSGKRASSEFFEATTRSLMRAAQFHEFPGQYLATLPGPVVIVPRWRARGHVRAEMMADMIGQVVRARGDRRLVVSVRLPVAAGKAARPRAIPLATGRVTRLDLVRAPGKLPRLAR